MAQVTDWLPTNRKGRLSMAKVWQGIVSDRVSDWKIPDEELTNFNTLVSDAQEAFDKTQDRSTRNHLDTVRCNKAFKALDATMRFFKKHYFLMPPLTAEDFASLLLNTPDIIRTDIPAPTAIPGMEFSHPGFGQVTVHLKPMIGSIESAKKSNYNFNIRYGIRPFNGATVEEALGQKRYLVNIPTQAEDLPQSNFIKHMKETFTFGQDEVGKTVYFCVRYQNAKGQPGPWSPIFHTVIS
ncbi:hypothetical protein FACS1894172_15140 [Spirochaetia bacterium]|nr:hypothetical protein FACS1894164_09040 [Spirochaetia bacterium]GHU34614.1 hypothetical protein FACS1894172_15140 [Spirochaetia bacterium]